MNMLKRRAANSVWLWTIISNGGKRMLPVLEDQAYQVKESP